MTLSQTRQQVKARVERTAYNEDTDVVTWETVLPDGRPYILHWPRKDFGPAMGIKALIPQKMLVDWLPSMVNKEFDLVIELVPRNIPMDVAAADREMKKYTESLEPVGPKISSLSAEERTI
jgi:hypothetical protein